MTDPRTLIATVQVQQASRRRLSTLAGIIQSNQPNRIGGNFFTKHTPYQCVSYSSIRRIFEPPPQLPTPIRNLLETAILHPYDMTDTAAPEYTLFILEGPNRPGIPLEKTKPLAHP